MAKGKKIIVKGMEITLLSTHSNDYISLTDMARYRDSDRTNYIIQNWMRTRSAIEFCGLWEQLNNPIFKGIEFDAFKNQSGSNMESTNALLIHQGLSQPDRLLQLNQLAIAQIRSLIKHRKGLEKLSG